MLTRLQSVDYTSGCQAMVLGITKGNDMTHRPHSVEMKIQFTSGSLEGITVSQTCNYATVSEAEKSHETWVRRFMRQEEQGGMGSPYVLIENPQLLVA